MIVPTFYMTNNGLHTHFIFPRNDVISRAPYLKDYFPNADLLQLGWGDYHYYGNPMQSRWMGLKALFLPTSAVLGILGLRDLDEVHINTNIYEIAVEKLGWNKIIDFICSHLKRDSLYQLNLVRINHDNEHFFAAYGTYSILNTCNTWSARALNSAGLSLHLWRAFTARHIEDQVKFNGYQRLLR